MPKQKDNTTLQPGYTLHNQYRIESVLGKGGFGITYKARDIKNNRIVAVKELFPRDIVRRVGSNVVPTENDQRFECIRNSFSKETRMLVNLQDVSDVVRLYHAFNDNGTSYYIMEYLEGDTLGSYLRKNGPMKWEQLSPIILTVVYTLNNLHSKNVIHRDVSPDNIFLLRNKKVRIIDFGNVRSFENGGQTFSVYLNPGFAPYEQFYSHISQGPYTDVYSLCATVYYSLTGILPQNAQIRAAKDDLVPLGRVTPSVPKHVSDAIMEGLAVRPENRIQSMLILYKRLIGPGGYPPSGGPVLQCIRGQFAGQSWALPESQYFTIGRQTSPPCNITYPNDYLGISRVHLYIWQRAGNVFVLDMNSSCGTVISDNTGGVVMQKGLWYNLKGCTLFFGENEQYCLR